MRIKRLLSDGAWKKMNVGMIEKKPSKGMLAMVRWQIHGTKPLEMDSDPRLTRSTLQE